MRVLTEHERRLLANLAIPRNVQDLEGHVRSHAPMSAGQIDSMLRTNLKEAGWVVKLGERIDPAKLASEAQKHNEVIDWHDESAEIYSRRMLRSDLSWRMDGDLWMLSKEGLAQLHAPTVESVPLTVSQTEEIIQHEWNRTLKGVSTENYNSEIHGSLGNQLLETEFLDWCELVSSACERTWGKRPVRPLAGGASGYSDAYEVSLIDAENQKTGLGAVVDPWFMTLSILALNDTDTGTTADAAGHIPTYTGYARKSVAGTDMPAATSGAGSAANTSAITFAACTAGTSTIISFGNTSAATVGTLRKWGDCGSTVISTTQTPATFAIGAYVTSTG